MKEKISGEKLITCKCARVQPKTKIGRWEISPEDKYRVRTPTEEKYRHCKNVQKLCICSNRIFSTHISSYLDVFMLNV